MTEFFVVTLPGLEDIAKTEIEAWYPGLELQQVYGGITVKAPLEIGLSMNLALKNATRILLRVDTFKCSDFPKLYNSVKSIPWANWINPNCEMKVHAATRLSRLKIKRRIEEACEDGWRVYQKSQKATMVKGREANLYVRIAENQCTLSLDTSGERLHKRGERVLVGKAPLRETIAAALIQLVESTQPGADGVDIVDPMMGSGTFLLEAAARDELVDQRHFAFEGFNIKNIPKPSLNIKRVLIQSVVGFESDKKTFLAAKSNLKSLNPSFVSLHNINFFEAEPLPAAANRWLFCNPPYGERLEVKEPLSELYAKIFAACERLARPDRACFILPTKAVKGKFQLPASWKVLEKRPFLNGGIPVTAFVFGRKST